MNLSSNTSTTVSERESSEDKSGVMKFWGPQSFRDPHPQIYGDSRIDIGTPSSCSFYIRERNCSVLLEIPKVALAGFCMPFQ